MKSSKKVVRASFLSSLAIGTASILYAGAAQADTTYSKCANEWGVCNFSGTQVIRYGDEGHYVFRTYSNGVPCRNDNFGGDPHPGSLVKTCSIQSTTASTSTTSPTTTTPSSGGKTYTDCASEWGVCNFSGSKVVRYGDEGHYVFKTFSNGTPCRNDAFGGDPHVGSLVKKCSLESGSTGTTAPVTTPTAPVTTPTTPVTTPAPTPAPTNGTAQRPSYNHGSGFFVLNGKLYDANGNEFRQRGVNKVHWDNQSRGLDNASSNTTRWTIDFTRRPSDNIALLTGTSSGGTTAKKNVVIPGNWAGTCNGDRATLSKIVDTWVSQVSSWKQIEKQMILNIANEWGPGDDGTVWRDAYIDAVARLRAAGYRATISITAGGCGQDPGSIVKWGKAVFDSDPEKNVIFDQHIYGVYADANGGAPAQYNGQPDLEAQVKALASTGLVVVLGEFGPGRNVGPSPTMIKPERVMELAEKYNLGWLAWAWDDNNLDGGMSNDGSFSLSYSGSYDKSADLTVYGRAVVEHPKLGLKVLSKPASIFR